MKLMLRLLNPCALVIMMAHDAGAAAQSYQSKFASRDIGIALSRASASSKSLMVTIILTNQNSYPVAIRIDSVKGSPSIRTNTGVSTWTSEVVGMSSNVLTTIDPNNAISVTFNFPVAQNQSKICSADLSVPLFLVHNNGGKYAQRHITVDLANIKTPCN
jgi:hypothetical protein